jgi:hypothetical protein
MTILTFCLFFSIDLLISYYLEGLKLKNNMESMDTFSDQKKDYFYDGMTFEELAKSQE